MNFKIGHFHIEEIADILTAFLLAFIIGISILLFAGCSTVQADPLSDLISKGLQTASDNLHLATTNGDLKSNDPAIACVDAATSQFGTSIVKYKSDDLISLGSVIYIRLNSLQSKLPAMQQACDALIGKFVMDAVRSQSPIKLR